MLRERVRVKNWGASACAAHYENVYDGRAGAEDNPRTLKMSGIEISSSHWLNVLGGHRGGTRFGYFSPMIS